MISLLSFFTALCVTAGVVAIPVQDSESLQARQGGNFANQYWENDFADLDYVSGAGGQYSAVWDNGFGGNFVVGKGYRPGGKMLFNYTGAFEVKGNAYLALYGWTTNPLVEYYVIESMGLHNPSDNASATQYGTVETDGGIYEIWQKERINAPSIIGTADFQQYWSIRTKMHCGGTINTGNHFNAWEKAGLKLGKQNYMVMAIEGQQGSGSATITVGATPTAPVPETTTRTQRTATRPRTTSTSTKHTSTKTPTITAGSPTITATKTQVTKATS